MDVIHLLPDRRLCLSLVTAISFLTIWTLLFGSKAIAGDDDIRHTTFVFNEFNASNQLLLEADAIIGSKAILLTNSSKRMIGRALYPIPVQIKSNYTVLSFSTTFVFSMVTFPPNPGGHGLAFLMTPFKSLMGALEAEYMGLLNITSNGQDYNHLFAVEFDTSQSVEFEDIDDNHIGVDLNNLMSLESKTAGYWVGKEFRQIYLRNWRNIQAWIDYDHLQDQLNVTISLAGMVKPAEPLISVKNIDLGRLMEEVMYVGFSASSGSLIAEHYVLAWSFSTSGIAPPLNISHLPSFAPKKSGSHHHKAFVARVTIFSAVLFLLLATLARLIWLKKKKKFTDISDEWELEYWPHRIAYEELNIATNGFCDDALLGRGGFGRVYKGIIPRDGLEIAVKCFTRGFTDGMKEFIAEITSMGRLQHRNLVQLRGWCRRNKQLFIVYDYMPNGSLDKLIFGQPTTVLGWPQRYRILKGVAAGLLYLHEEWEQRIVHRDVKSSNVLLDSNFNARLGDFGLARLYDHGENPHTTHVVGTLGYIAPELTQTGKATPSADVFSFGALLLEVACGRRPVEPSKDADQVVLTEWVLDLYATNQLKDAVDPKLGGEYDAEEMERVLILGLFCSYPEPLGRPTIKHALQILEGEVPLPPIPLASSGDMSVLSHTRRLSRLYSSDVILHSLETSDYLSSTSSSKGKSVLLPGTV